MTRFTSLLAAVAVVATAAPAVAQSQADARMDTAQRRFDNEYSLYRRAVEEYRSSSRRDYRPSSGYYDQRYNDSRYSDADYDAARDYRDYRQGNYQERVLTRDDTVYAGSDNRYYCKRSDGTTGLIVGAALGGVFGNVVDGGRQRTLGTLLGGAGGALRDAQTWARDL